MPPLSPITKTSTAARHNAAGSFGFGDWGLGFGVWGLGFEVWGLGFRVWGLGLEVLTHGLGPRCPEEPEVEQRGLALALHVTCDV